MPKTAWQGSSACVKCKRERNIWFHYTIFPSGAACVRACVYIRCHTTSLGCPGVGMRGGGPIPSSIRHKRRALPGSVACAGNGRRSQARSSARARHARQRQRCFTNSGGGSESSMHATHAEDRPALKGRHAIVRYAQQAQVNLRGGYFSFLSFLSFFSFFFSV